MKLKRIESDLSGHSVTMAVFEKVNFNDTTNLTYTTDLILKVDESEFIEGQLVVFFNWFYVIFYKGTEVFEFHATYKYEIIEVEVKELDDYNLDNCIRITYIRLKNDFENRRKEFSVLPKMGDIPDSTIKQLRQQLSEVLLQIPE